MSGGSLNYFYTSLEERVGDFQDKELDDLVKDMAKLFHDREWYLSDDTGEGSWNESRDAFKAKWFTEHGRQERIEKYLVAFSDEVRKTFGIGGRYCKECKHWSNNDDSEYGKCEFEKHCLIHRSDSCEKFAPKEGRS